MKRRHHFTCGGLLILVILAPAREVRAHDIFLTTADGEFKSDGIYDFVFDIDAPMYVLKASPNHTDQEIRTMIGALSTDDLRVAYDRACRAFEEGLRIRFNRITFPPTLEFPPFDTWRPGATLGNIAWSMRIHLRGEVPEGAEVFDLTLPEDIGIVQLNLARQDGPAKFELLKPGQTCRPFPLTDSPETDFSGAESASSIAWQYLVLGFEHIMPWGLDHILFVLGLFLLSPKLKTLLWQVTAFTVAHSVTLTLSITDVFTLPASIVEPIIAMSIAYIAIENVLTSKLKPWRLGVVFMFGLLHGLGFAAVLGDLGIPWTNFVTALLSFNIGIEIGQLSVILLALLTVGWFRKRRWYRSSVTIPLSCYIGLVGLYWTVHRLLML